MGQGAKRFEDMRRNPRGDWTIDDVQVVCSEFGFRLMAPSSGSHYKLTHRRLSEILTIPARRPIKPVYIKQLVALVSKVVETDNDN